MFRVSHVILVYSIFIPILTPLLGAEKENITVMAQIGMGTYHMRELKDMMTSTRSYYKSLNIPAETMHSFPPYYNFHLQFIHGLDETSSLGGYMEYASTGSRIDYRDYSGNVGEDLIIEMVGVGPLYKETITTILKRFKIKAVVKASFVYSWLHALDYITVYDESESVPLEAHSYGLGLEHGYSIRVPLKMFVLGLYGGFQVTMGFPLHTRDVLRDQDGNKLHAQWMGFRFGVMIGLK